MRNIHDWVGKAVLTSVAVARNDSYDKDVRKTRFRYGTVADWLTAAWPGGLCKPGEKKGGEGERGGRGRVFLLSRSSFTPASSSVFKTLVSAYITI